ncbi:MAG: stage III sporulation AC/AD family protein [Clostridia bacterium]|nr:stage III sporulation AC/AD family protein [Clostridia bacterium]
MTLWQMGGLALLCAMAGTLLRESGGGRQATLLSLCGGAMLLVGWLARVSPAVAALAQLSGQGGLGSWTPLLLKALAVGYVTEIGADACRELGAEQVGAKLELCGRAELVLLALPCLTELLRTAATLVAQN